MQQAGVVILAFSMLAAEPPGPAPTLWKEPLPDLARSGTLTGLEMTADGALRPAGGCSSGEFVSAEREIPPADRAVLSWNARGAEGARLEVALRARVEGAQTPWAILGVWEAGRGSSSVKGQQNEHFRVEVDTLVFERQPAGRLQLRARLWNGPGGEVRLTSLVATHWKKGQRSPLGRQPSPAWGRVLEVPARSQMVEEPSLRGSICSPTSLAMVLAYHGVDLPTAEVAKGVRDREEGIFGNWPSNTAFAAAIDPGRIRESYVRKLNGFEEAEAEIAAGRPLVLSHRWKEGDLTGAPISQSSGHLVVLIGFTAGGDPVVNDPAASPARKQEVRRTYPRAELYHTWLELADGIAYVVVPAKP